jgi:hypothetical protein
MDQLHPGGVTRNGTGGVRFGAAVGGRGATDDWLTPPGIVRALGPFDLDPCSPEIRPWNTAAQHYTRADDGLSQPWHGMVWLNPPYSNIRTWLARLADHGSGIALVFARTETAAFHDHVWPRASALLFLRGRLRFHRIDGEAIARTGGGAGAGAPSVLVGYGDDAAARLRACKLDGHLAIPSSLEGAE